MEQRDRGLDAVLQQDIDQPVIEIEPRPVHRAAAARQDPTPGCAEAIRLQSEAVHQGDVIGVAPIVVAGDVARITVANHAWRVRESLPDARPGAVGQWRALDLIRRGRGPPQEVVRKFDGRWHGQ